MTRACCRHVLVVTAMLWCSGLRGAAQDAPPRPLRIDDLLALEGVAGEAYSTSKTFMFSPDGQAVAFPRIRPKKLARSDYDLEGANGGDIWVQEAPGRPLRNLTQGVRDGSSWWNPQWSPDGQWLTMQSTRGGQVTLWGWERATNRLRRLTTRELHTDLEVLWVDSHRLLCIVEPAWKGRGTPPLPRGDSLTANVLESGVPPVPLAHRPQSHLLLIDVTKRTSTALAHIGTVNTHNGVSFRGLQLSPRGQAVAFLYRVPFRLTDLPDPRFGLFYHDRYALALRFLDGRAPRLAPPWPGDVIPSTLRWSPDGQALAFFSGTSRQQPPRLWRLQLDEARVQAVDMGELDPTPAPASRRGHPSPQVEWTQSGDLLIQAVRRPPGPLAGPAIPRTWWLLPRDGSPRELTAQEHRGLVAHDPAAARAAQQAAQRTKIEQTVAKPAPTATLAAVSPTGQSAVYVAEDRTGTAVWRVEVATGRTEELVRTNRWVREVAALKVRTIEYTSLNGDTLMGRLVLPVGYQAGTRVPLVTIVYAGDGSPYRPLKEVDTTGIDSWNELYAGRGYAVLYPSMPLRQRIARGGPDEGDEPLAKLTNGVLPALDTVIAMGIADSARLFVMGWSYGGYSTYGLITQTHRFKAAVAGAGDSDLVSSYGQFSDPTRYTEFAHEVAQSMQAFSEIDQMRMGTPPWQDWDRYRRNSPITYVDRVQTPLLIMHGDRDFVPMAQAEEFFMALYRQSKRVRFVRYWGEGHFIGTRPANFRDFWQRLFAWFDEFGDISRDANGSLIFENGRVKSRGGIAGSQ